MYGSRYLIDHLHKLGFCFPNSEVKRVEQCAYLSQATDVVGVAANIFLQFVCDNVDHNRATLDGSGTFHGMGMIAATTPSVQLTPLRTWKQFG